MNEESRPLVETAVVGGGIPMIAPIRRADPGSADDALVVMVDEDAEPADLDGFLDALDRIVERRLSGERNALLKPSGLVHKMTGPSRVEASPRPLTTTQA